MGLRDGLQVQGVGGRTVLIPTAPIWSREAVGQHEMMMVMMMLCVIVLPQCPLILFLSSPFGTINKSNICCQLNYSHEDMCSSNPHAVQVVAHIERIVLINLF